MLKEFHEVNEAGEIVDVHLLDVDDENVEIPHNFIEGWSGVFFNPVYDFQQQQWVEGKPLEEILTLYREDKIKELNEVCKKEIEEGFEYNGHFFEFEIHDQTNFTQQVVALIANPNIQTIDWKTKNNGIQTFSREDFFAIIKEGENHKRNAIQKYWILKSQVEQASSREEISTITWNPL